MPETYAYTYLAASALIKTGPGVIHSVVLTGGSDAATLVLGRNGSAELSSPDYRFLDSDVKMNVTRLTKGELLLSHAVFRQPVRIRFPKPAYLQRR